VAHVAVVSVDPLGRAGLAVVAEADPAELDAVAPLANAGSPAEQAGVVFCRMLARVDERKSGA